MRLKNILILPALRLEVTAQIGPGVPLVRHHETGKGLPDPGRQLGRGHRFAMPVDEGGRALPPLIARHRHHQRLCHGGVIHQPLLYGLGLDVLPRR